MTLISLVGDVGSGKTLFATYLASKDNRPIFSNYKIKLPTYTDLKPETLTSLTSSCLVIIDEAYTWLESRLSGRNINLYLSYILFQSRKRGLDIILTDQLIGTIDVRFRQLTNYEIYCQNIETGFEYTIHKVNRYANYKPMKLLMPYSTAEKIFPLYDSWELISPIDDNLVFNITEDKGDIISQIDEHTKILLKSSKSKISKPMVSDYCLRNNLPKSFINLIYNSIKTAEAGIS
jgi:hypothetical protein